MFKPIRCQKEPARSITGVENRSGRSPDALKLDMPPGRNHRIIRRYVLNEQRQAFLATLEADLTGPPPDHQMADSGHTRPGRPDRTGMRRGLAAALVAGASLLAFAASPAQAAAASPAPESGPVAQSNCFTPDFVPWDHTKTCDNPIAFVNWQFVDEQWTTPYYVCYVFDGWWYGCGGGTELPRASACGYDWGGPED